MRATHEACIIIGQSWPALGRSQSGMKSSIMRGFSGEILKSMCDHRIVNQSGCLLMCVSLSVWIVKDMLWKPICIMGCTCHHLATRVDTSTVKCEKFVLGISEINSDALSSKTQHRKVRWAQVNDDSGSEVREWMGHLTGPNQYLVRPPTWSSDCNKRSRVQEPVGGGGN